MDLVAVTAHLKTYFAAMNGNVSGAAEYTESMAGEFRPETFPAAYVIPLGEEATPNDQDNSLYQIITERIGVVVEFDNSMDRRGQGVTLMLAPVRASLWAAILNWRGTDPEHAIRGFEAAGAGVLWTDRARIFWQWEFTLPILVTDADGWQVDGPALLEIDANSDPDAPTPPFKVLLPQPEP